MRCLPETYSQEGLHALGTYGGHAGRYLVLKIIDLAGTFSAGVQAGNVLQLVFAVLLLILGVIVAAEGIRKLLSKDDTSDDNNAPETAAV